MIGYCDVDKASDLEDRRSTIGFVFMIKCGVISWSNKPQFIITSSIHGKHPSYQRSHMDDKVDEGIKVHEREEGDGDLM
jgi:hypothetical protein